MTANKSPLNDKDTKKSKHKRNRDGETRGAWRGVSLYSLQKGRLLLKNKKLAFEFLNGL